MNYIGSKFRLSDFILQTILKEVGDDLSDKVFCDLFAGTGIVGRTFKPIVKKVISNDLEHYSFVLNSHYVGNCSTIESAQKYIDFLNDLQGENGFITIHYSEWNNQQRNYFSVENAQKIDAIRIQLKNWINNNVITNEEFYLLLTALIEAADKVANTASVYGAYLKKLKKTAQNNLVLVIPDYAITHQKNEVYQFDSAELIKKINGDILYLDPPYNHRQYGANYHMLNTLAKYDDFEPKGITGIRDYVKSDYCKKGEVSKAFEELIKNAQFSHIFLSYNNEGLMTPEEIKTIMERYGSYKLATTTYQRFKADKTVNRNHKADSTIEFLHILQKF